MKKTLLLATLLLASTGAEAQKKNFSYHFYGQVRADVFYNSRANKESADGIVNYYPLDKAPDAQGKDLNGTSNLGFYTLYSRLGLDVQGPDLKNGAIDAVVLDELPAREIVARNQDLEILTGSFAREEYAIAVKKGNTELLEQINASINKAVENGDYDTLRSAFMPADGNIVIPAIKIPGGERTLRLGTNAAFPPFEYVEGSEIVGFDISMGRLIARDCGAGLEVVDMAFDSLIPALSSGAVDFVAAGMSVNEERRKNVDFSIPYFESEQVIIIRKAKTE